jgi:hypothetical protein
MEGVLLHHHLNGLLIVWLVPLSLQLRCITAFHHRLQDFNVCPDVLPRALRPRQGVQGGPIDHVDWSYDSPPQSHTVASSACVAAFCSPLKHRPMMSCHQEVCADSPKTSTSTFTTTELEVHPAGMKASLLNSGDAPPTPNGGGTKSKTRPQTRLYSFPSLISLLVNTSR